MKEHKTKTFVRRAVKTVVWMLVGMVGLIILLIALLQFPAVQHAIAQKAVSWISEKTKSRIEIGSVNIAFTHSIVLKNIYVESRRQDTLLSIQTLAVDVNLLGFFSHDINLTNVRIDSLTAHITRASSDSSFNFDFIINALSSNSTSTDNNSDTSASSGWKFRLGGLHLKNIQGTYEDEVSGLNLRLQLGTLDAAIDKIDLETMKFYVGEATLSNTDASVTQTKISLPDTSSSADVDVRVGTVLLKKIRFNYENKMIGERYVVDLGTSTLVAEKIDLPLHRIALKKFLLENTNIVIDQPKTLKTKKAASDSSVFPWIITLDQLALNGMSAQYDVQGAVSTKGLDLNHLRIDGLTMDAANIYFSANRVKADIGHSAFQEHSGIELRELSGGFIVDSLHAQFTDFTVETAASRIHQNSLVTYSSLSALKNFDGAVNVKTTISDSHLAVSELLFFLPSLPLKNNPTTSIQFSSSISGSIQDLRIEDFQLAAGDSTSLNFTGSIHGLPEITTAIYDVNVRRFLTGRNDIQSYVADTLIPKNIVIPAAIKLSGMFKGSVKNFSASSIIETSIGNVQGNVELASVQVPGLPESRWKTDIIVEEFNVGSLLNDTSTFGPVTLKASAVGMGLSKDDITAQLNVHVEKAVVNGYPYQRLTLHGTAGSKIFEGRAEIQDSNIAFTFNGTLNLSEENPAYKFIFDLKGADLHRLHVTKDDIRVAGIITSDLTGNDINDINGTIAVRNIVIFKNSKQYGIDSLVFVSVKKEGISHFSFESPIFAAQLDGTIIPGDVPEILKGHAAHYFTLQETRQKKNRTAQNFTFHVTVRDPITLSDIFVPDLQNLSAGTIEGNYDSEKMNLNVKIDIPRIEYSDLKIDSLTLRVTSDADLLQATVKIGSISDSTLQITNLQLTAKAGHDSIDLSLQSTRSDGFTKMLLAGVFNSDPEGYTFRFKKDGIIFQNISWNVPADNYLLFGKNRFLAHHVLFQGAEQSFSLMSTDEKNNRSPLKIEFKNFELATVSQIVERSQGLLGGMLNGNIVLQNLEKKMAFTSDLTIKDVSFVQKHLGDVTLHANNRTENIYEVNMNITGNGNQIAVKGKYLSEKEGSKLDLQCDFTKVDLATLEPFTFGSLNRLSGTMTGGLHITGTVMKPNITGDLNFTNTAFNPTILDTYLRLNNGRVLIGSKGVEFRSFNLIDTRGNIASVSGHLFTENFRSYTYDFKVHTEKFLLLNKPASRDALYYGTVILNSDISVKGDREHQIVTMQAELDKGTNLALVLPESELAVEERRGIIRFVDVNSVPNAIMTRKNIKKNSDTTDAIRSSMDFTSNITVNKDAKLRILIDPVAGDSLVIQGEATLSFSIDPSGKLSLTGRYEILNGSYQLSFGDFIRREFAIAKGSSLTWFGSPFDADVDITAVYTVKTTALDLVQNQLSGISQEERNKYKQELPIQVHLEMKGKLLKPDIHFKLDLPPDKRGVLSGTVYAKLNELNGQESELNKQVFALLVLGKFIPENPMAAVGGNGGLSDIARSSVSQILSEQLNRLSEQYIAGASLNVGLESYKDYSTGNAEGRTQLQLALSKQLFDERMTVQVGGNVDLEGERSQKNSLNNFAGDLKVFYKLAEDGRWQLQVFRQNSYEGAIDGDITKTGVGIVFTVDYDKLFGFTLKPVPK